jgi:hypothetical protein
VAELDRKLEIGAEREANRLGGRLTQVVRVQGPEFRTLLSGLPYLSLRPRSLKESEEWCWITLGLLRVIVFNFTGLHFQRMA